MFQGTWKSGPGMVKVLITSWMQFPKHVVRKAHLKLLYKISRGHFRGLV